MTYDDFKNIIWRKIHTRQVEESDLAELEVQLCNLLRRVASKKTFAEAKLEMQNLKDMHSVISIIGCRFEMPLSEKQILIFREYDTHHIYETRLRVFELIQGLYEQE